MPRTCRKRQPRTDLGGEPDLHVTSVAAAVGLALLLYPPDRDHLQSESDFPDLTRLQRQRVHYTNSMHMLIANTVCMRSDLFRSEVRIHFELMPTAV